MRVLWILGLIAVAHAKFCLRDEAPTKVKINDNGQPELTCEQPKDCELPSVAKMHSCTYYQAMCPQNNEWVSGIHDSDKKFGMACCQSPYLAYSRVLGTTKLFKGDVFAGGAWQSKSGTRRGIDVVSNIERVDTAEGMMYKVTVGRITCPQRPPVVNPSQLIGAPHNKYDKRSNVAGNLQGTLPGGFGGGGDVYQTTDTQVVEIPSGDYGTPIGDAGLPPADFGAGLGGLAVPAATGFCFSEDVQVTTLTGRKMMKDLRIGDRVLTVDEKRLIFSTVESWLHRYPEVNAEFVRLELEDGTDLTLTPDHFIYHTPCNDSYVGWQLAASKVIRPEIDCVVKVKEESMKLMRVVSSERVIRRGVYGPMTGNANIVVNDLAASCHATVRDTTMLTSIMSMTQAFDTVCDSTARAFGFKSGPQDLLNELPKSLTALVNMADMIFPSNWKVLG